MGNIIKPTISRKVWFRPNGQIRFQKPDTNPPVYGAPHILSDQPLDATVVYVWHDRMVNLLFRDHYGNQFIATSVTLVQPDADPPAAGFYAEWMPYQAAQAQKAEAIDRAIMFTTPLGNASAIAQALGAPVGLDLPPIIPPCKGTNCGATDGVSHSAECKAEHDAAAGDFPLGKACDLSGEGACESCQ